MDRRARFTTISRALNAFAPLGTRRCRRTMNKIDVALQEAASCVTPFGDRVEEDATEVRLLLRARCGMCSNRCGKPLE